jgi:hypothetical protein
MRRRWLVATLIVVALAAAGATGGVLVKLRYGGARIVASGRPAAAPQPTRAHPASPSPSPSASVSSAPFVPAVPMVPWRGPVEGLFFHPLVLQPRLAFTGDRLGRGFADYFVTAREFRGILDGLWRNGWTLVDAHRAAAGTVRVPVGRKPLVLSEDDVNYYGYFDGRGLAKRLVLDPAGDVKAEYAAGSGVRLTDDDVVPLVEEEVAAHPEFSADGAKGVLAVTGYEGLFGEHDLTTSAAQARVRSLVARLRATGWLIASHTYGHIDLSKDSLGAIARDTARWKALTRDVIGPTDLLIYPFGARPSGAGRALLRDAGFTVQFDIDIGARRRAVDGVVVMSRRHIDGYAFAGEARALRQFFDVAAIVDPDRPRSS